MIDLDILPKDEDGVDICWRFNAFKDGIAKVKSWRPPTRSPINPALL